MLTNSKKILLDAKNNKYALPAPDYIDLDSARVFVDVAEKLHKPMILSFAEAFKESFPLEEAAMIGKYMGEKVTTPVILHLDHGTDIDFIEKSIALGFTSVMIDASMDSFDENVRKTKVVVEMAKKQNITVEAEIGHVGQGGNYQTYDKSDNVYTNVAEAQEFVQLTGIDSLAVSIGTAHGIYKGLKKPILNFDRLHELSTCLSVPLVLHGGSGSGDDNLARCAKEGISKINIFTDFLIGAMDAVRTTSPSDYTGLKQAANTGMAKVLEHYYSILSN